LALLPGCGSGDAKKGATVKGKIVSGGKALSPASMPQYVPGQAWVRVTVRLVDSKGDVSEEATAQPDGSFQIEGVAPGKHKVAVEHFDQNYLSEAAKKAPAGGGKAPQTRGPEASGAQQGGPSGSGYDRLEGKFNAVKTPISLTVAEGKSDVDLGAIDLEDQSTWPK
jgi:hypothetical protein